MKKIWISLGRDVAWGVLLPLLQQVAKTAWQSWEYPYFDTVGNPSPPPFEKSCLHPCRSDGYTGLKELNPFSLPGISFGGVFSIAVHMPDILTGSPVRCGRLSLVSNCHKWLVPVGSGLNLLLVHGASRSCSKPVALPPSGYSIPLSFCRKSWWDGGKAEIKSMRYFGAEYFKQFKVIKRILNSICWRVGG